MAAQRHLPRTLCPYYLSLSMSSTGQRKEVASMKTVCMPSGVNSTHQHIHIYRQTLARELALWVASKPSSLLSQWNSLK